MDDKKIFEDMGLVEGEGFSEETFAEMDDNKGDEE